MFYLEAQIQAWSDLLRARGNLTESDIRELENHLQEEIEELIAAGLAPDESFLISVKLVGNVAAISHEYSKVNTDNLWKQLLMDPVDTATKGQNQRDVAWVIILALMAGTLAKIP